MRIAILGGTGDIGAGLALRWAYDSDHEVLIGSRDPEKARSKAEEYETELDSRGRTRTVNGFANEMAADRADVVVLAIPPEYAADTLSDVAHVLDADTVVVSPAVAMRRDAAGFHYDPPEAGSVTAHVADAAPDDVAVVGALHTLAADRLANLDLEFDLDVPLVGEDDDAKGLVADLVEDVAGLRPLDAGGIENAPEVESLTPLVVNLAINGSGLHDVGVKFQ